MSDDMGRPDTGGFVTLSSRIVYENPWTRLREDIIRRPDGGEGLYGVVERSEFVVVLPLGNGPEGPTVTLVRQYRYPVRARLWELPMGMWEHRPDTDPEIVAHGELEEETGLRAFALRHAGTLYQGAGYSTQRGHVYLATGLTQGPPRREATEGDMTSHTVPLAELERMIRDGEITCMVTLAAVALVRARGWIP
ncbi:NUDIX hydrolase [Gluconacetobacter azotocaptans]|uniref:NUDIX domain-containing protein n=1 Tax=Gluconacetobacter azotocaptans TaxID=142834 RepID=UPI0019568D3C|nr:NUDIX hydrolase [Gluconacetobacter azotocaptans]MBM9402144.1 NUDIX hydrolase [Gluconacetobacter azotocaptans]